jgi:hypothetical protein
MTANWRQLSAIPESALKHQILKALDIDPPPEGISDTFHDRGLYLLHRDDPADHWIVSRSGWDEDLGSVIYSDGSDALKAARCPAGTPMGDALRRWMRSRGWKPLNERSQ